MSVQGFSLLLIVLEIKWLGKKAILNDPTGSTVVLALEEETGLAQLQKMLSVRK